MHSMKQWAVHMQAQGVNFGMQAQGVNFGTVQRRIWDLSWERTFLVSIGIVETVKPAYKTCQCQQMEDDNHQSRHKVVGLALLTTSWLKCSQQFTNKGAELVGEVPAPTPYCCTQTSTPYSYQPQPATHNPHLSDNGSSYDIGSYGHRLSVCTVCALRAYCARRG